MAVTRCMNAEKARCDDCRRIWPVAELVEPKRLSERLDPGGTVPAGECPECGALAYLLDDPLDALDRLARETGYAEVPEDGDDGGIDALIDYKNAVEDRCRQLERTLGEIGHVLPRSESWDGAPGRLELAELREAEARNLGPLPRR